MSMEVIDLEKLDTEKLIKDLLGLEPAALLKLPTADGRRDDNVLYALGRFMRRALETTLQVGVQPELTLQVVDAESPTAALANLSTLLVYGLVPPLRRVAEFPDARLAKATGKRVKARVRIAARLHELSIDELIAEWEASPKVRGPGRDREEVKEFPISVAEAIESILGVDAETLYLYRKATGGNLEVEERAIVGLERLMHDVLLQYKIMRERRTIAIRLMHSDDAKDAEIGEARAAQIATLFAAALHANEHEVYFLSPRRHAPWRKTALRETAKAVYCDYSEEALRGFELICDDIVHFGHGYNHTLAERLLSEVALECDPDLQAMPNCVGWQLSLTEFECRLMGAAHELAR